MCDDCAGGLHEEMLLQFTRRRAEHRIRTAAKLQIRKRIGATIASSFMLWTPSAAPCACAVRAGPPGIPACYVLCDCFLFLFVNTSKVVPERNGAKMAELKKRLMWEVELLHAEGRRGGRRTLPKHVKSPVTSVIKDILRSGTRVLTAYTGVAHF